MIFRLPSARLATAASALWCLTLPAAAEPDPGAYLAARHAMVNGDYGTAAAHYRHTLLADPTNTELMEKALTAYLGTGEIEAAAELARAFHGAGEDSQLANIALMAQAAGAADWAAIFDMLEAGHQVGPLMDGLAQAWAHVGMGKPDRAMMSFDEVIDTPGLRPFGQHHKALALMLLGDFAAADAIYSLPAAEGVPPSRATLVSHARVLAELGAFERAQSLLTRAFGEASDPEITAVQAALAAQEIPALPRTVTSPAQGIAYGFVGLADVLQGEADESYLLLYAQAARHIAPQDADAQIATAQLLTALEQYDAAARTFAEVATSDPAFHSAELGRAEALRLAGRVDQAIEVLTQLTRSHPQVPLSHVSLGDAFRQQGRFEDAAEAYSRAIAGYGEEASILWWLHYTRGIAYERIGDWPRAEADFRAALARKPDSPSVLNYLGYSLVDRGLSEHYDEALAMIEAAAAARPDNGAIVDSLAWVYFTLGRYQEAVEPMERAAELEPNDPILSDHLGDVYWMVGRKVEARFQWRRALSFDPEEAEAERIRRKLEVGLDAVYAAEGVTPAPAVEVANDI
ncbi:tetratricopeptide repeat protein [Thalassorhabdomicrobium marinisediminis]|uniref:tetratricopeptide repeat protein n=1 Tax=Thalassorhabdomicrobium marinisediminis TaxID=2170577 RepID=UPI0024901712|nr:tetratricopeptide repeat protein [Thalassorhabdomicrobium marinisediminis]